MTMDQVALVSKTCDYYLKLLGLSDTQCFFFVVELAIYSEWLLVDDVSL